ncbi:hypothetical protein TWF281_010496 [Arthrobotrys megalospora]
MTSRYLYCALCGLPFDNETFEDNLISEELLENYAPYCYNSAILTKEHIWWSTAFRVLTTKEDTIPIDFKSPSGQRVDISDPAFWEEYERVSFPRSHTGIREYSVYGDPDTPGLIFRIPVHVSCIVISHELMQWRKSCLASQTLAGEYPMSLDQLYQAILQYKRSQKNTSNIEWANGYYGARLQWAQPWLCQLGTEVILPSDFVAEFSPNPSVIVVGFRSSQPNGSYSEHLVLAEASSSASTTEVIRIAGYWHPVTNRDTPSPSLRCDSRQSGFGIGTLATPLLFSDA